MILHRNIHLYNQTSIMGIPSPELDKPRDHLNAREEEHSFAYPVAGHIKPLQCGHSQGLSLVCCTLHMYWLHGPSLQPAWHRKSKRKMWILISNPGWPNKPRRKKAKTNKLTNERSQCLKYIYMCSYISNFYIFQTQIFNKTKIRDIHTKCTRNTRHIMMHSYGYAVAHGNNCWGPF